MTWREVVPVRHFERLANQALWLLGVSFLSLHCGAHLAHQHYRPPSHI